MKDADFSGLAEVIPQISYEIVGRIIPGIIIIFSLFLAVEGPAQGMEFIYLHINQSDFSISGWFVILLIIISYIVSFILDGIWNLPSVLKHLSDHKYNPNSNPPPIDLKFDIINKNYPKKGAWLTKLYAETNNTQILIIGWSFCAFVNLVWLLLTDSTPRSWLELVFLIAIIGAITVRQSITRIRDIGLEDYWFIHNHLKNKKEEGTLSGLFRSKEVQFLASFKNGEEIRKTEINQSDGKQTSAE